MKKYLVQSLTLEGYSKPFDFYAEIYRPNCPKEALINFLDTGIDAIDACIEVIEEEELDIFETNVIEVKKIMDNSKQTASNDYVANEYIKANRKELVQKYSYQRLRAWYLMEMFINEAANQKVSNEFYLMISWVMGNPPEDLYEGATFYMLLRGLFIRAKKKFKEETTREYFEKNPNSVKEIVNGHHASVPPFRDDMIGLDDAWYARRAINIYNEIIERKKEGVEV